MKKLLVTLISLVTLSFLIPSAAQAAVTVSLSPATANVKVNDLVNIVTTINPNGATVGAAEITYSYDAANVGFVSFTPGIYSTCVPGSDTAGRITRNCAVLGGTTQTGAFGTIVLKVLKQAEAKITVSGEVLDENNSNLFNSSVVGTYKVASLTQISATPQPSKSGDVKSASTSATPILTPTVQPTIAVRFGNTDIEPPAPETKVKSINYISFILIGLAILLIGYFVYRKGILPKLNSKKVK